MKKEYKIEAVLRQIKFNAEYALNAIEHVRCGDIQARQIVNNQVNTMKIRLEKIEESLLNDFLFKDE